MDLVGLLIHIQARGEQTTSSELRPRFWLRTAAVSVKHSRMSAGALVLRLLIVEEHNAISMRGRPSDASIRLGVNI
jgi:hypothetical protein